MIMLFLVPVDVAASLCLLSPGRQAAYGIGITVTVLAILWVMAGGHRAAGLTGTFVLLAAPGVALAGLAHLTHRILGPRLPVWGYAIAAAAILGAASVLLNALAGI